MSPRSILKRAAGQPSPPSSTCQSHAVHFPPSPSLCRTFDAYSPTTYDRTPIVVSKNNCALPERGCPGRTYVLDEQSLANSRSRAQTASSRSYHPRALNSGSATQYHSEQRASLANLPQLIPDLSSESDESDGFSSSPHLSDNLFSYGAHGFPSKYQSVDYQPCMKMPNTTVDALAFLPYPPSPPANYNLADDQASKSRKKRSESRRRHDGAADPDRISRRREYLLSSSSGFSSQDDGCLGGF